MEIYKNYYIVHPFLWFLDYDNNRRPMNVLYVGNDYILNLINSKKIIFLGTCFNKQFYNYSSEEPIEINNLDRIRGNNRIYSTDSTLRYEKILNYYIKLEDVTVSDIAKIKMYLT